MFWIYIGCVVLLIRLPFSIAQPHFVSTTLGALNYRCCPRLLGPFPLWLCQGKYRQGCSFGHLQGHSKAGVGAPQEIGLTRTSTTGRSIRKRTNTLFDGEPECEVYGCPMYSGDVADETVRAQIQEVKDIFPRAGKLSLPFGSIDMAACSQRGTTDQHRFNQDRGVLISPYYWKGDAPTSESFTPTTAFFVAIFDGHGDEGHHVSRFLQKDMADRISKKLSRSTHDIGSVSVEQALKETFIESDRQVPEVYAMNGGSTASLILRLGGKIYFANVGDSTTFVASYNKRTGETKVVHRNRKDKPHLLDERARIEASGGKVRSPPDHPIQARVGGSR